MAKHRTSSRDLDPERVEILRAAVQAWLEGAPAKDEPKRTQTRLAEALEMVNDRGEPSRSGISKLLNRSQGASIGFAHKFADFIGEPRSTFTGESSPDPIEGNPKEVVRRSLRFVDAPQAVKDIYDATAFLRNKGKTIQWWSDRLELAYRDVETARLRASMGLAPEEPVPGAAEIEVEDDDE